MNIKKHIVLVVALLAIVFVGCNATEKESAVENSTPEENVVVEVAETSETTITTEALKTILEEESAVLVDARPIAGFNGWTLGEEVRGGHIAGATSFDASWITQFETEEALLAELNKFGITKDKDIITYGYGEDAKTLANKLQALGYETVNVYEGGIVEWAADPSLAMSKMTNYDYLVSAEWVKNLMAGETVENYDGRNYIVFEASWGPGDNYEKGHIPEAVHINTDEYEVGPLWNRVSDEAILQATLANGITKDTMVVVYGSDTTPAARIAIMLKYLGVEDVRLLDGGYQAWTAAGYDVATGMVEKKPVTEFGLELTPAHPEYIIDMPEAEGLLAEDNGRLVSIRSVVEFTGETSGYDYIEAAGRIDGAVYGFAGSDPWHMEDYRNIDNTAVNYEYMAARWEENDINPTNENAFYCGTGWRASETWFYAHAMGWENVALYDGGWKEWSEAGKPMATDMASE